MKNIILALILFIGFSCVLTAQNFDKIRSNHHLYENASFSAKGLNTSNFFQKHQSVMGLTAQGEMRLYRSYTDHKGVSHHRYHQYHKGIKIYGETYILHEKNNVVFSATGRFAANLSLPKKHSITKPQAIQRAKEHFHNVVSFKRNNKTVPQAIQYQISKTIIKSIEDIIIDYRFPENTGIYKAAYLITLHDAENPLKEEEIVIDKASGHLIFRQPLILHHNVPSTGLTKYYGVQSFMSDSISPTSFRLRDTERNISVVNGTETGNVFSNNSNHWELSAGNQHAIDAHYATTVFYDMMLNSFNWEGIDGTGGEMKSVVNIFNGGSFIDAYWDGTTANFGNGDCHNGPLTTLSIVGHEFMHGITDYTSNLVYESESGALNEAFSDIFGKASEFFHDNEHFSWQIGPEGVSPFPYIFRSMSNPTDFGHPKFYKGLNWKENGNVHTNSSVLNHWFYLMVEGGIHTNEADETYDITPIEMVKVLQILFDCQTSYLTESSNYTDMYEASKTVAEDLYGIDSDEYESLLKAWGMVGLPNNEGNTIADLSIQIVADTSICSTQEFIDLNVILSNMGTSTFLSGESFEVSINYYYTPYTVEIILTTDLLPGEDFPYTFPDFIIIDRERPIIGISAILQTEDAITFNNFNYATQYIFYYDTPEINILGISFSRSSCFSTDMDFFIRLQNASCATLSEGQVFDFTLTADASPITFSYTLDRDYLKGEFFDVNKSIPEINNEEEITYIFEFTTTEDGNLDNNQRPIIVPIKDGLKVEHLYTFDDASYRSSFSRAYPHESTSYQHDGEHYLAMTKSLFSFNKVSCVDIDDNFTSQTPFLEACLDLTDLDFPYFEFDMIQFRNNEIAAEHPDLSPNTSVVKIEVGSVTEMYYNQIEGEPVHHILPLPPDYKGKIKITVFNERGYLDSLEQSIALYDVVLFDNFYIGNDQTMGIAEESVSENIFLHPNPTRDNLHIITDKEIVSIDVFNVQGGKVSPLLQNEISAISQEHIMDTSKLASGIYFVRIGLKGEGIITRKFVKY